MTSDQQLPVPSAEEAEHDFVPYPHSSRPHIPDRRIAVITIGGLWLAAVALAVAAESWLWIVFAFVGVMSAWLTIAFGLWTAPEPPRRRRAQ